MDPEAPDMMESPPLRSPPAQRVLLKRATSPLHADVWRIDKPGHRVVLKSFEERSWLLKTTIGRWVTNREVRNLRDLEGIMGIPKLIARPTPWSFEMSFMEAQDLPTFETRSSVTTEYFDALDDIVRHMHARGMSHGDLRRRNLLRHPDTGQPVVLDFAQAISRRDWLLRPLLSLAFRIDEVKLLRLRQWYVGTENLTREQRRRLRRRTPALLRFGQFLRRQLYRPYKYWYLGKELRARKHRPEGYRPDRPRSERPDK